MLLVKAFFRVIGQVIGGTLISLLTIAAFLSVIACFAKIMDAIIGMVASFCGDGWTAFTEIVAKGIPFVIGGFIVIAVLLMLSAAVYDEYQKLKRWEG